MKRLEFQYAEYFIISQIGALKTLNIFARSLNGRKIIEIDRFDKTRKFNLIFDALKVLKNNFACKKAITKLSGFFKVINHSSS